MKRQPSLTRRDVRIILEDLNAILEIVGLNSPAIPLVIRIHRTAIKIRNRAERDKRK